MRGHVAQSADALDNPRLLRAEGTVSHEFHELNILKVNISRTFTTPAP
jgi:hypothetical protein